MRFGAIGMRVATDGHPDPGHLHSRPPHRHDQGEDAGLSLGGHAGRLLEIRFSPFPAVPSNLVFDRFELDPTHLVNTYRFKIDAQRRLSMVRIRWRPRAGHRSKIGPPLVAARSLRRPPRGRHFLGHHIFGLPAFLVHLAGASLDLRARRHVDARYTRRLVEEHGTSPAACTDGKTIPSRGGSLSVARKSAIA